MTALYLFFATQVILFSYVLYKNYEKLRDVAQLYNVIHERNNGEKIKSVFVCLSMILKMFHTKMILRGMNTTRVDKNSYEVSYSINNRQYKMHVTPITGPSAIMQVTDENEKIITDIVLQYYGPEQNWHGKNFSPSFFGCKTLTFESFDGTKIEMLV